MRNPDRIPEYCDKLAWLWSQVPDWRFGQLMSNMLGAYYGKTKRDIFFAEDEEMFDFFDKFIQNNSPYYGTKEKE